VKRIPIFWQSPAGELLQLYEIIKVRWTRCIPRRESLLLSGSQSLVLVNKIDFFKLKWRAWKLSEQSEFGYDPKAGLFSTDDDNWKKYLRVSQELDTALCPGIVLTGVFCSLM